MLMHETIFLIQNSGYKIYQGTVSELHLLNSKAGLGAHRTISGKLP